MKRTIHDRRSFLRTSGIAGTSLLMGSSTGVLNGFYSSGGKIRIGVIGTGSRGQGLMKIIRDLPNMDVIACCDILPWRLQEGMQLASDGAQSYENHRELLKDRNVVGVIISTPLYLHAQMALDALDFGKHVYCEKTMVFKSDQSRQLVEKTKKIKELVFQVGYQYRSSKLYQSVVKMVQNGSIGTVSAFLCQWNRNGDWRRAVPDPDYEKIINWRMYRDYSRGLLGELSSHQIDFVNWATGNHPVSVIGTGGIDYWKDGRETYDNVHVVFDYPDGVKASFTCTTANAYDGYQIKILGNKATIVLKPDEAWIYPEIVERKHDTIDGVTGATISDEELYKGIPIKIQHEDPSRYALLDFAENIIHNKTPLSNIYSGSEASTAVEMAQCAIQEERCVKWTEYEK